jgi:ABC-type sugar transport system ATPase subunit
VVIVSHNLADVFQVADRIVVLRLGRVAGVLMPKEATAEDVVARITGAVGPTEARE